MQVRNQLLCGPLLLQYKPFPFARLLRGLGVIDLTTEVQVLGRILVNSPGVSRGRIWLLPLIAPLSEPFPLNRDRLSPFINFLRPKQVQLKRELVNLTLLHPDRFQIFTFFNLFCLQFLFQFLNFFLAILKINFKLVIAFLD